MSFTIRNATTLTEDAVITNRNISVVNNIFSGEEKTSNSIDFENDYLLPGFIDIQVYGANDTLFSDDPSVESLTTMYNVAIRTGTTSFVPTIATNAERVIIESIDAVRKYNEVGHPGVHGLHLEGPYINPIKKGAHLSAHILKPAISQLQKWLEYGKGIIKIITLAPEVCSAEVIELLQHHNVSISLGHTDADFTQANLAFDKGVHLVTHLFNAMRSIHHRDAGLAVATMLDSRVQASIVADGYHVSFEMIRLAKTIMEERLFLITDAVANSAGVYPHKLSGEKYILPDGTLSGSSLSILKATKNCIEFVAIALPEAIRMASLYPAKAIGIAGHYGSILPGYKADFVRLDKDLNIVSVFKNGEIVYDARV
ncbi:MAG: N-acetylglucosamine-6-phosphate deacetylase [Ferruginibacter sp.]